jgi:hypothetical protein
VDLAAASENDPRGGRIVAHYRIDRSGTLKRSLGAAAAIVTLASIAVATAIWLGRIDASEYARPRDSIVRGGRVNEAGEPVRTTSLAWELGIGALGIASILSAGTIAIRGLHRALSEESYLVLRTDGALFRDNGARSLVRWEEIEGIAWDEAKRAVCFVRHDGSEWSRGESYAGIDGRALAKQAAEVRRKALFGIL